MNTEQGRGINFLLLIKVLWKRSFNYKSLCYPVTSAEEMIKNIYPLVKRCWVRDNMSKKISKN